MTTSHAAIAVCALLVAGAGTASGREALSRYDRLLDRGWEFRQAGKPPSDAEELWRPAVVPGTVHLDLLRNGLIPDPYYRDNESKLQWIGLTDWEYRVSFDADAALLARRHSELVFAGLDTFATVFVNDHEVLRADNMFREWRVDLKPLLVRGHNELRILFRSAIQEIVPRIENLPYRLPTVGQVAAQSENGIATNPYVRKSAYHYGWDWGPRFVTAGVWRPVRIQAWDDAAIRDVHVKQDDVSPAAAHLTVEVEIEADSDGPAVMEVEFGRVMSGERSTLSRSVSLHRGGNRVATPLSIVNPALWYPAGYGRQDLYDIRARVVLGGREADQRSVRTGLRSVVVRRDRDEWGRSFEFVVNGIPIFAKGANVIPLDSFAPRVTLDDYRRILGAAVAAHMNMVRVWGGGYYETDEFYDLCDQLGLMVWQDFMFGGDMTPGDPAFLDNVRQEAIHQVRRLRNHPSLVLWCGNNEVETAFFNWGDRKTWRASLPREVELRVWQDYLVLFKGVLAEVVASLGAPTTYWPSSPSSDFEAPARSGTAGDMHYWDVWHGLKPVRDYEKQFPRFMSEYGFQSFPEMRTIGAFSLPEDWSIESSVMKAHQKNEGGNERIREYLLRDYREPKDFSSFVYLSQVLQANAIKIGAEHLRRNRPRVMGSLYWQLNDCWPVASWSSIDYYGRWKALHYYARRFYDELLVSPVEENGSLTVYVVSDRLRATSGKLQVRSLDVSGRELFAREEAVEVAPLSSAIHMSVPIEELKRSATGPVIVAATFVPRDGPARRNLYYFDRPKDIPWPKAPVTADLIATGKKCRVRLSAVRLAKDVNVSFDGLDAGVSDNDFDMLPGETVELDVESNAGAEDLRQSMSVRSLVDAFAN